MGKVKLINKNGCLTVQPGGKTKKAKLNGGIRYIQCATVSGIAKWSTVVRIVDCWPKLTRPASKKKLGKNWWKRLMANESHPSGKINTGLPSVWIQRLGIGGQRPRLFTFTVWAKDPSFVFREKIDRDIIILTADAANKLVWSSSVLFDFTWSACLSVFLSNFVQLAIVGLLWNVCSKNNLLH